MMDEKKVRALLHEMHIFYQDDLYFYELQKKALEAFGNNEEEVIGFLKSLEGDLKLVADSLSDELIEKFPSDEMKDAFDAISEWSKTYVKEINLRITYSRPWIEYFDGERRWTYDEWMKEWPTYEDYKCSHPVTEATMITSTQTAIQDAREGR